MGIHKIHWMKVVFFSQSGNNEGKFGTLQLGTVCLSTWQACSVTLHDVDVVFKHFNFAIIPLADTKFHSDLLQQWHLFYYHTQIQ